VCVYGDVGINACVNGFVRVFVRACVRGKKETQLLVVKIEVFYKL